MACISPELMIENTELNSDVKKSTKNAAKKALNVTLRGGHYNNILFTDDDERDTMSVVYKGGGKA